MLKTNHELNMISIRQSNHTYSIPILLAIWVFFNDYGIIINIYYSDGLKFYGMVII